jgi:hypothetical protein
MAHAAIHAARQLGRLAFAYEVYGMIQKTVAACANDQQQPQHTDDGQTAEAADAPMVAVDRLTYNLVFSAIVGAVDHGLVEQVFSHMTNDGVDPDAFTFNTLIAAAAHAGG